MTVVVDAGVLLAAADADDDDHQVCAAVLREHRGELWLPAARRTQGSREIERNVGPAAEAAFVRHVASGQFKIVDLGPGEYERCAELIDTYADLGLGIVDASVITVAENLGVRTLATLNRRDFTVVRPRQTEASELLP